MHWFFPPNRAERRNWLIQSLMQASVDVDRILVRLPQFPENFGESPGAGSDFLIPSSSSSSSSSSSTNCEGDGATCFWSDSRVFTFTLSGLSGVSGFFACSNFNVSWSLSKAGVSCLWEGFSSINPNCRATLLGPLGVLTNAELKFITNPSTVVATYIANECDINLPGVTVFTLSSSTACSGWPATINMTAT